MAKGTTPAVQAVVEAVRREIRKGGLRKGAALPAETDLASHIGVSRGTVRRAIDILVGTGEVVRRPNCRPIVEGGSDFDAALGSEVHVWISRKIADCPSMLLLKGISQALAGSGRRLVVREPTLFTAEIIEGEERQFLIDLLHNDAAGGAIIERNPYRSNSDLVEKLIRRGKRLVFVDVGPPDGVHADHVGTTNTSSARRCVEHLLELGHRRIACVVDNDTPRPIKDRIRGYWRAMAHAGLESEGLVIHGNQLPPPGPNIGTSLGGPFARNVLESGTFPVGAQSIVSHLLSLENRPTALFVVYDFLAYSVCAVLEGAGVEIPGQMSVVGFDWKARSGDGGFLDILTTASQDFQGFGRHAVDILLDRFADGGCATPRHILLDAPLVVRSSTTTHLVLPTLTPAGSARGHGAR